MKKLGRKEFGDELMVLCEKYGISTIYCGALLEDKEGCVLVKIGDDTVSAISVYALLVANIPDVHELFNQIVFQTYLDQYKAMRDKASGDAGDLLKEFQVEGKFKN